MKRNVYLNYASIITGLGDLESTWQALVEKKSAIVKKEHFDNALLKITGLSLYKRNFNDQYLNLTQSLLEECLADLPALPKDTLVIWTGIKNNVEFIESIYNQTPAPKLQSASDFRLWVSQRLGLANQGFEINAACASSAVGVALAANYIAEGCFEHVLVVGADIVSQFVYYGFASLKAMTESICMPFDLERNGLTLGDGAVALFLSASQNSNIRISGCSVTNDANHITGPSRDGAGLAQAIKQAVQRADLELRDVQAFCAHGTGTRYNDAMELAAMNSLYGELQPKIFGVKGAIGHTLGAAGGIEIALCARSLSECKLLPTVGCQTPATSNIVLEPTAYPGEVILTTNSGFGGVNAAVIMEKV